MTGEQRPTPVAVVAMWIVAALAVLGVGISLYMTWHHDIVLYGGEQVEIIGCGDGGGCTAANTSEWSELFGVPQFTWAIPTYLLITGLAVSAALGRRSRQIGVLLLGIGVLCVAYSAWMFYLAWFVVGSLCAWCTRLYLINLAIPILAVVAGAHRPKWPDARLVGTVASAFAVLAALAVGGERVYRTNVLGEAGAIVLPTENLAAAALDLPEDGSDQEGDAPTRRVEVVTETKKTASFQITADDAWKGNRDAEVVVVEFADFQCPFCKQVSGRIHQLFEAYGDRVLFVYKHYPLSTSCNPLAKTNKHRYACPAAYASVCAQDQGRFWAMHDVLFKNQHALRPDDLTLYAEAAGLDTSEFGQCMREARAKDRVAADIEGAKALDFGGTPRIFVNDELYRSGHSVQRLAQAIDKALGTKSAGKLVDRRTPIEPIPADVAEMAEVKRGDLHFFIDTFESGITEGAAVSGKHVVPALKSSWFDARDACAAAGKRLCTEREWVTACQGAAAVDDDGDGEFADDMIEGTQFPYGDYHQPGRCWEDKKRAKSDGTLDENNWRPVYTGEMPGCVSADGVYDLAGNVQEWVGGTEERAALLGGMFESSETACYDRHDKFGAGYANYRTGFRCCRDPDAPAAP